MPRFFVPDTVDVAAAEQVWRSVRENLDVSTSARRVYAVTYEYKGRRDRTVRVGETASNGEPVMLILEGVNEPIYFVCTPSRSVLRGWPIVVGHLRDDQRVVEVIDFEA
jgi:hypothetical protein